MKRILVVEDSLEDAELLETTLNTSGYRVVSMRDGDGTPDPPHRAAFALPDSESYSRTLLEAASDGIFVLNSEGDIEDANEAGCHAFGYAREELLKMNIADGLAEGEAVRIAAEMARVRSGEVLRSEWRVRRKDGTEFAGEVSSTILPDGRLLGILRDITERRRAEAALRASEEFLRLTLAASNVGLFDWDLRTNRVNYSREWKNQIGYEDHEISDDLSEWESRCHPEDLARVRALTDAYLRDSAGLFESEFRFRHRDGRWLWIVTRAEVIRDAAGQPVRILGCHVDATERKRAEDVLHASEKKYRELTESLTELIYRADPSTFQATYVNRAIADIYGYSVEEWLEDPTLWERTILPEERERVFAVFLDAKEKRQPASVEYRIVRSDGAVRCVDERFWWEVDDHGEPVSLAGIISDVTERKEREEALRESARKLNAMVNHLPGFVYRCANLPNYPVEHVSEGVLDLLGYPAEDFVSGKRMPFDMVLPEDVERVWNETHAGIAARQPWVIEYRMRHANGDVRWAWEHGAGVFEGDQLIALEGFITDITERKRIEEELLASEKKYRELTESLAEIVYRADPTTLRTTYVNRAVASIYGYSVEEWVGDPTLWEKTILPEDRERVFAVFLDAKEKRQPASVEYRIVRNDGSVRWVDDRFRWELDDRGEPVSLDGIIADVTERKEAEEALRESTRKLNAMVNHLPGFIYRCANLPDYPVEYVSEGVFDLHGYPAEDFMSGKRMPVEQILPEDVERVWNEIQAGVAARQPYVVEYRIRHANGEVRWAWERGAGVFDGDQLLAIEGFVTDITERKRAEEAVRYANERLQSLSRRLLEIQERDRRQLARELHDEFGQMLTAVKINLQTTTRVSDPEAAAARLEECVAIVDCAIGNVRVLSLDLRPPMLDDLGLAAAIRWLANKQTSRAGLRLEFRETLQEKRYDTSVETACFRIGQEAIHNVVKHAGARRVVVELEERDCELHLHVRDDGGGFDVTAARLKAARGASFGLIGMEERASLAGGGIEWRAWPGKGAEVHAWFPDRHQRAIPKTVRRDERR